MLRALVGSKSVEKILIYLLVNDQCYAHQIHRKLGMALTPVQKSLEKLEKGKILCSFYEKNRKIYRFNLDLPLIYEIEQLLKKAYHQLPLHERRFYHHPKGVKVKERKSGGEWIRLVWEQLKSVSRMTLIAASRSPTSNMWTRKGKGSVETALKDHALTFQEQGEWLADDGCKMSYRNMYRWTFHWREEMLSLEHLRYGEKHPVFLYYLVPGENGLLESMNPHLCGDDAYFGWLQHNPLFLQMHVRTIGPSKNEKIETVYT